MVVRITPKKLSGAVVPPPAKSAAHRIIIAAALGDGVSTIRNVAFSKDIDATLRCMGVLGAAWSQQGEKTICVRGIGKTKPHFAALPCFDCGESGSTLRFVIPIALALCGGGVFTGQGRLMERPMQPYFDLFTEHGIRFSQSGNCLTVEGALRAGEYRLAGNVSSQFFTGLLFALSLLDAPSRVISTTELESADYVTMTVEAMASAGVRVEGSAAERMFTVYPGLYRPVDTTVEADWSQSGFWYAAKALGSAVEVQGLNPHSAQGDRVMASLYQQLCCPGEVTVDLAPIPDLLPPLAVIAAVREGTTRFINGARLRMKESDRLKTVGCMIKALGGCAEEGEDSLTVRGVPSLSGGTVDGANDHRIVMASAVAATACRGSVTILGGEAAAKSYPDFFEVYRSWGGEVHVL